MITGKLCGSVTGAVNSTYKGVSTDSVKVAVDNINNTISAELLVNYKNQVFFFDKFVAGENVQEQFTESEFVYCYDGTSIKGGDTGPNIVLHFPQTSDRAIYLKKIHIKYIEDGILKEYNHEFVTGDFTAIGQIATLNGIKWELQNDTTDVYLSTSSSNYGLQIGSNKKPARNLSLKTGDFIHKTIKEITITACGAASANVFLSIDVGGFDWLYHENQTDQATSIELAQNDISSPLTFTYKNGTTLDEAVITEYKNVFLRKDEDEIVVNQPQQEFLYINRENNRAYRFDGTTLIEVSKVLELGSTADTAYRGDWGQQNYTNIQNILNKDVTLKGDKTIEGKLIVASAEGSYDDTLVIKPNDSSYPDIKIGYHDDGDMFATSVPALHVGHLSNLENNPLSYISCYSDISMENATILNVPDPTNEKDVANKKYVDEKAIEVSTYDTSLSSTSTNAVQNKVVNSTISELSYQLAMVRENLFQTVLSEIDYTEDFATFYPIPDTLSDTDGTHRVLFSETQLREVAGNSIAYNQNSKISRTPATIGGLTFATNDDGSLSISGTSTGEENISIGDFAEVSGHKFLAKTNFITGKPTASSGYWIKWKSVRYGKDYGDGIIFTANGTGNAMVIFTVDSANTVVNSKLLIQLFDLTLMGLDSVSTVEEARSELLKRGIDIDQYNPYSEGEIRNTTASGVKVNGYNLLNLERTEGDTTGWERENTSKRSFDETKYYVGMAPNNYWSPTAVKDYSVTGNSVMVNCVNGYGVGFPIRVFPGKTYKVEFTATDGTNQYKVGWYDREGSLISFNLDESKNKVAPDNAYWGLLVLTSIAQNTDVTFSNICFHLSTLRTGYAPYKEPKAISFASTELLGAGETHDTIEVVEGDKVAGIQRYNLVHVKRVGTVDLGTLSWIYTSTKFAAIINTLGGKREWQKVPNLICSRYKTVGMVNVVDDINDKSVTYINNEDKHIQIKDTSYTDATAFKTAMSGVILNYELATPTRTTIAENLTFEEVSATIEQGGSIESVYETLAPNCTTGFVVKKATEVSK